MTLVTSYSISGWFSIMTSDTRKVKQNWWYDEETGEYEDANIPLKVTDERSIKSERLSFLTLVGAGGVAELCEHLRDRLREEVPFDTDLVECKAILERIVSEERARKDGPTYLNFLDHDKGVCLIINGFCRDGRTGMVTFTSGKGSEVQMAIADRLMIQYGMATPVKKYMENSERLFSIPSLEREDITPASAQQTVLDHLGQIHGLISYAHPVQVSADAEFHVLTLDENGEVLYGTTTADFTHYHAHLKEMERLDEVRE